MATSTSAAGTLKDAYRRINDNIAAAAARFGRTRDDVLLVAVTKTASPDQIRALVDMGQVDFAENRVQHLQQRVAQLEEFLSRKRTLGSASTREGETTTTDVRWHMIGHLQRNKVKTVVPLVKLIHSVDTLRLTEELQNYGAKHDQVIDILLQVNSSGETQKFGIHPPAVHHLLEQIDTMMFLRPRGLMTMAPYVDNPEAVRGVFRRTAELFQDIKSSGIVPPEFRILSMGMTGDYEVAVEEGANLVRIGRGLFGDAPEE
jgi:hypothetical protein